MRARTLFVSTVRILPVACGTVALRFTVQSVASACTEELYTTSTPQSNSGQPTTPKVGPRNPKRTRLRVKDVAEYGRIDSILWLYGVYVFIIYAKIFRTNNVFQPLSFCASCFYFIFDVVFVLSFFTDKCSSSVLPFN